VYWQGSVLGAGLRLLLNHGWYDQCRTGGLTTEPLDCSVQPLLVTGAAAVQRSGCWIY
jgi:hypothetical protein